MAVNACEGGRIVRRFCEGTVFPMLLLLTLGCGKQQREAAASIQSTPTGLSDTGLGSVTADQTNPSPSSIRKEPTPEPIDPAREALLSIWRSPNSTSQERVDAVTKLVPVGASVQTARRLLGEAGVLTRYHGPSVSLVPATNNSAPAVATHDFWQLAYQNPGGGVALRFESAPDGPELRFVRAFPFK